MYMDGRLANGKISKGTRHLSGFLNAKSSETRREAGGNTRHLNMSLSSSRSSCSEEIDRNDYIKWTTCSTRAKHISRMAPSVCPRMTDVSRPRIDRFISTLLSCEWRPTMLSSVCQEKDRMA